MEISNEIINVLNYLGEKFGIVIDWTSKNAIPYAEQLCRKFIQWELSTSIAWLIIGIIFCALGVFFCVLVKKCDDVDLECIYITLFIVAFIVGIVVILTQTFDIIECCTFPEKTIYEYLKCHLK